MSEDENQAAAQREFEAIVWPKSAGHLYRRAGQELAREQGQDTAGVITAGTDAEYLYRWQVGEHTAESPGWLHLEMLLGDAIATRAAEDVGTVRALWIREWICQLGVPMTERVQRMPSDPPPADTPEESAYRTVATHNALTVASDHHVARAVLAGAAAVARLRRHTRGDVEASTEEQIEATTLHDPVIAAAWDELDAAGRRGPGNWVVDQWDVICSAADELAVLTIAATAPATVEQRIAIAQHEVRHGMLAKARDCEGEGLQQGYRSVSAYGEALAEGRVRWEANGGAPDGTQEAMRLHADAVAEASGVMLSDESRTILLNAVIARWPQLAPPV